MWSAIKHSLNNTLGTFKDTPLDKIVSGKSYEAFYDMAKFIHLTSGSDDGSILFIPKSIQSLNGNPYADNEDIKTIIFPYGFREIKANDFSGCVHLENIFLPDSLTNIRAHAFDFCTNLKTIYIPSSVSIINSPAFSNCDNLTDIYIDRPSSNPIAGGAPWGATNATIHYKT